MPTTNDASNNAIENKKNANQINTNDLRKFTSNCLIHISIYFAFLIILGSPFMMNCKIAQSGMFDNMKDCEPFIDNHPAKKDGSSQENYIATDQITFLDKNYQYDTWGKVIVFDRDEVIQTIKPKINFTTKFNQYIFGLGSQDILDNLARTNPSGMLYDFITTMRETTSFQFDILHFVMSTFNAILPESLIFIAPAFFTSFYSSIFIVLIMIIIFVNIVYFIYRIIKRQWNYGKEGFKDYISSMEKIYHDKKWYVSIWFLMAYSIIGFIILICAILLLIFLVILLSIPVLLYTAFYSISIIIYLYLYLPLVINANVYKLKTEIPLPQNDDAIEQYTIDLSKQMTDDMNILEKIDNPKYTLKSLLWNNLYYKMNWIVLTITIIIIYNCLLYYSYNGINILLLIILIIIVIIFTRNLRKTNPSGGIKPHAYIIENMVEKYMVPIIKEFSTSYKDYKCTTE